MSAAATAAHPRRATFGRTIRRRRPRTLPGRWFEESRTIDDLAFVRHSYVTPDVGRAFGRLRFFPASRSFHSKASHRRARGSTSWLEGDELDVLRRHRRGADDPSGR